MPTDQHSRICALSLLCFVCRAPTAYNRAHRELQRQLRRSKRARTLQMLDQAEQAANIGNSRDLFGVLKLLCPRRSLQKVNVTGSCNMLASSSVVLAFQRLSSCRCRQTSCRMINGRMRSAKSRLGRPFRLGRHPYIPGNPKTECAHYSVPLRVGICAVAHLAFPRNGPEFNWHGSQSR